MPVGPLLVVPRDLDAFLARLALVLWVNDEPRQRAEPRLLRWDLTRMVAEAMAREERRWDRGIALPITGGAMPAGTLLLSGTPEGVVFRSPQPRQIVLGVLEWLASFGMGGQAAIMAPAIRDARAAGQYLRPGDVVTMRADGLGMIVSPIMP
jgi:2-keto-4-pentenoate hydratase/2-oxohepta-3-ene-1,7-dioic acid hydratase in catechol pathway